MNRAFFSGASVLALLGGCTLDAEVPTSGAGGGGGSTTGAAGAGGAAQSCAVPQDCPPADPCYVLTCPAGTCGVALATFGAECGDPATEACDGAGNCVGREGHTCTLNADCLDSPCADGFCCDTVCDSPCSSCSQVGLQGTCTPHPVSENPEGCLLGVCDGGGSCASGAAGARGTIGTATGDTTPLALAVDGVGSATVLGHFTGTTNAGESPLVATNIDIFVARFDSTGQHVWSKSFDGTQDQYGYGVAAWPTGEVVLVGTMDDGVDFGGGAALPNGGAFDAIMVKLAANGGHVWSKSFGDSSDQSFDAVAIAPDGDVVVVGELEGTVDLAGTVLTSAGVEDVVVARFDSDGNLVWAKLYGDNLEQRVGGVAVDAVGNVFVVGHHAGTIDFGATPLTSAGGYNAFLAKLDPSGNHVWSKHFGDAQDQRALGVAAGPDGSVAIVGRMAGTADFGGSVLTSAGVEDAFAAVFAADGTPTWSKRFGDVFEQQAYGVDVDLNGNVVVTGDLVGSADFGGGPIASFGNYDAFVAKFSADGTHLWSQRYGDISSQQGRAVRVSGTGSVWLTGTYLGLMDFGVGPQLSSPTGYDGYWVQLLP